MTTKTTLFEALQVFAQSVKDKVSQLTLGEPEDQLRAPFENFIKAAGEILNMDIVPTGETKLPDRLGRPDFAIHNKKLLAGHVELKAPGTGADTSKFKKGHNRDQWKRFQFVPNILYTDGNEWALYQKGKLVGKIVRFSDDITSEGKKAVTEKDAQKLDHLLRGFLDWEPYIPKDRKGRIDLKAFAEQLAPLCRLLRDEVTEALQVPKSPLEHIARDWRQLLFPDASDKQFADAYAQTVTFALLLGRSEGADPLTLDSAEKTLAVEHSLLSKALEVLTDEGARQEITVSLDLLLRVIAVVPIAAFAKSEDPWLYFYEDFLSIYDPELRKNWGVYYTPVEVVHAQVRLIDDLLVNRFGKSHGFCDPGVITLDPAAGTGTYLLGVVEHALQRVEEEQGAGAMAGQANSLGANLYGFEIMVGPYAVTELRISRALRDFGAHLPKDGTRIYLTDTLESPNAEPKQAAFILKPIADQHEKALKVKSEVPVIVCLGNPPYDRHDAVDAKNEEKLSQYGGWVRFGDPLSDYRIEVRSRSKKSSKKQKYKVIESAEKKLEMREKESILQSFIKPAKEAGHGVHIKNLYNLYVYFWRWALWKVFEHETASGPGVVSFISASSYMDGDAFSGMRQHMRQNCDEIWILDLGGEGRGTRKDDNVFAIQTPVAIGVAMRSGKVNPDKPAKVHYARIEGTREEKLARLDAISGFAKVKWEACPVDWQAPFRPAGTGNFYDWPLLTDLLPWQHSGAQFKRTWPIAPDSETLENRWKGLLNADDKSKAFHGTGDREINGTYRVSLTPQADFTPISKLPKNAATPPIMMYGYRSFDRQRIIADGRLMSRPRPDLWRVHGDRQVYLTSAFTQSLSTGPAVTASSQIPDLHYFSGRGAKDTVPLYRDPGATEANLLPGLLDVLSKAYKKDVQPEDFAAYVYGVLAHPAFTARFEKELASRELRVPLTQDKALFEKARDLGARLLWLHTYGERFVPKGKKRGHVPRGKAKCTKAVPGTKEGYPEDFDYDPAKQILYVGEGEFAPVSKAVYEFEVSGLKVVQSWLHYRKKQGAGKKSSPLDQIRPERWTSQFTTELLELLWVLEATVEGYPEQANLLEVIVSGDCFRADELPPVPEDMRKPPKAPRKTEEGGLFADVD